MITPFLLAIQFLTRLPVPVVGAWHERDMGRSLLFYPLVGLIIGGLLTAAAALIAPLPHPVAAALLLACWVLVTGALHLDGLADSADGWLGGHGDRARTLAIMQDPRSGPAGVTLLVLVLLIKFTALEAALDGALAWPAFLIAPLLGRAVLPLLFLTTRYVRPGGLGAAMAQHLPRRGAMVVVALSAGAPLLVTGTRGLWMVAAALAAFVALRALMQHRLGGATGDTAGALVEITEAACLVAAIA